MNGAAAALPRLLGRAGREAASLIRPPSWLPYMVRVFVAATLTFYLAFRFQLPTPYSAVTTVLIVANPVRGAIVSKSVWRIVGTVVGAVMGVVQFALLAQSVLLFDLFLAAWMAICCAASTLLRFFPAYGAVLAGYTVAIVDAGAIPNPDDALLVALFRLSVVVLGIVVTGLVFLLTQGGPDSRSFGRDEAGVLADVAALLRDALAGAALDGLRERRRALAQRISALEQAIVYAGADRLDVRARGRAMRVAGTRMLGALTSGLAAAEIVRDHADVRRVFDAALEEVALEAGTDRRQAHAALDAAMAALVAMRAGCRNDLALLGAVEQARDTLERLARALADLEDPGRRGDTRHHLPVPHLRSFHDLRAARRNGIRGGLVVIVAALFWYLTYAPDGSTLLVLLVPAAAIVSTTPLPSVNSVRFAAGIVLSTLVAVPVQALLLPQTNGFPLAIATLLLFMAPGVALQTHPRWGLVAFGYVVFYNTQVSLQNPMRYDLASLLANGELYFLAAAGLVVTFRILLPPDYLTDARVLAGSLGSAASRLAAVRRLPNPLTWENVQLQKLQAFSQRLEASGSSRRNDLVGAGAASIIVGRIVLQLRGIDRDRATDPAARAASRAGLAVLRRLRRDPGARAAELEARAAEIPLVDAAPGGDAADPGAPSEPDGRLRVAALLQEASRLIARNAGFFDRNLTRDSLA